MRRPGGFDDSGPEEPEAAASAEPDPAASDPAAASEPAVVPAVAPVPRVALLRRRAATPAAPASETGAPDPTGVSASLEPVTSPAIDPVKRAERELKRARRSVKSRERREQRRFTAHLRRRRRTWLIVLGAVLGLALFVAIGVLSPVTAVREVRIVGAEQVSEADLQEALARFDGVPLALVSEQDVHRALEPFPLIQRYSIERIPPHTLVVRIEERDAVIAVESDGTLQFFDPAGVLVGAGDAAPSGVPVASGQAAVTDSEAFAAAGRIIRDLPDDVRQQLAAVTATSAQDVTFTLVSGTEVIWGENTETQRKALVLRAMLTSVGGASQIDVSSPNAPVFQ